MTWKKLVFFVFLINLVGFSASAQYEIIVRDQYTEEPIEKLSLHGIDEYEISATGVISFSSELKLPDSLIISAEGYHSRIIHAPYRKRMHIELSPLSHDMEAITIRIDYSERSFKRAASSVLYRKASDFLIHNEIALSSQLNKLPGVYVQTGTAGTSRVSIRGIGSRTPYSSNRIKAYLDDFPLTDGDGITVIEDTEPELIRSVEVLKGPAAMLYGSGLGGVLKFNTHQGEQSEQAFDLNLQYGSFNTGKISIGKLFVRGESKLRAFVSHNFSEGFRQNNSYKRTGAFLSFNRKFRHTTINSFIWFTSLYSQIPSSLNFTDYKNDPSKAADNWNAVKGFEEYKRLGISTTAKTILGRRLTNRFTLNLNYTDPYERRPFNVLDELGGFVSFSESLKYSVGNFRMVFKTGLFLEYNEWKTFETEIEGTGALINHFSEKKWHANSGLLLSYDFKERFLIKAGINLNYTGYKLIDQSLNINNGQLHHFEPVLSPSFGLNYRMNSYFNWYASAAHGFSPPSTEETLLPDGVPNTDLQAETGVTGEIGLRFNYRRVLNADIVYYAAEVENMLVTKRITEDNFMGINAGRVLYRGIEIQNSLRPLQNTALRSTDLLLRIAYSRSINSFVQFVDDGTDYSGKQLPGIPKQVFSLDVSAVPVSFLTVKYSYMYSGKQYITDDNTMIYPGHQLSNLSLSSEFKLSKRLSIKAETGIRNVFDRHYAGMLLINAPSFGGSRPRYYYPGEPRNLYLAIQMKFL